MPTVINYCFVVIEALCGGNDELRADNPRRNEDPPILKGSQPRELGAQRKYRVRRPQETLRGVLRLKAGRRMKITVIASGNLYLIFCDV